MPPIARASAVSPVATVRLVAASFVAGVGAMVLAGLIAPVLVSTGLDVREAEAAPILQREAILEPLDLVVIESRLAEADQVLRQSARSTDAALRRLERLSGG